MKPRLLIALLWMIGMPSVLSATPLALDAGYMAPDGMLTTYYHGRDIIDPYFPTKALLIAQDSGMDIATIAPQWIDWIIAHQEPNGLINRFCKNPDSNHYHACMDADADDAMLALWIELLYRMAPTKGLPVNWKRSAALAEKRLDELYDTTMGVYVISTSTPVALFMDNMEIYNAFQHAAREATRLNNPHQSQVFKQQADRLQTGIIRTFWDADAHRFKISTQARTQREFYPDMVAQVLPILYRIKAPSVNDSNALYQVWMRGHQHEWFDMIGREFPWGVLAVLAMNQQDFATAHCWLAQATPHRNGHAWNILDETTYQIVEWGLQQHKATFTPPCEGSIL